MSRVLRRDYGFEPPGYTTPPFPSLHWPPEQAEWSLYHVYDAWRFTLIWTLILYAVFHSGAALLALAMQFRIGGRKEWAAGGGGRGRTRGDGAAAGGGGRAGGRHTARRRRSAWKYLWTIPLVYAAVAGIEAVFAGSIVGLVLGAVYNAGYFAMSTWIPFIWGWINVLVLIISSFTMQGGL